MKSYIFKSLAFALAIVASLAFSKAAPPPIDPHYCTPGGVAKVPAALLQSRADCDVIFLGAICTITFSGSEYIVYEGASCTINKILVRKSPNNP